MARRLARGDEGRDGDRKPYAVLDIETDGLRGPLIYWAAGCECDDRIRTGFTAASLWKHVLGHESDEHAQRDHVWWAHNGGEYDYVYLFDSAREDALSGRCTVTPIVRSDQMIGFRVSTAKHRTDLRDSYAVLPSALKDLAAQLAPDLPKLDIGLADGVTFDPDNPEHRAYARRDVQATIAVLVRFRSVLAEAFDGALPSWSAASTALRAWQRTIPEGVSYSPDGKVAADMARASYYGGLVHPGDLNEHTDMATVDVNSMYPSVMRSEGVPVGWWWRTKRFDESRPGFYHVNISIPEDTPFTFIPYRDPTGVIGWPTGRFSTHVSSAELQAARARGATFQVISGVVWGEIGHPFDTFVDRVETMRREGGAIGYVAKIMANSLYGKFGSKPLRDEWVIAAAAPTPNHWPPADISRDLRGLWVARDRPLRAPYLIPHWAAWITAQARLRLLTLVEAVGARHVVYTDTDSITAPAWAIDAAIAAGTLPCSAAFGDVKVEQRWSTYQVMAPKVTRGVVADGAVTLKAKGIPKRLRAAAFAGERVEWDSPNGALQVLQGAPMTTRRKRSMTDFRNSVAWRADAAGAVRPVHLGTG